MEATGNSGFDAAVLAAETQQSGRARHRNCRTDAINPKPRGYPRILRGRGVIHLNSLGVLNAFEESNPLLGQAVYPGSVAQQGEVTQRRIAVLVLALGNVGHNLEKASLLVLGVGPEMAVVRTGYAFGQIEADKVLASEFVEHAPHFPIRIGTDVGRCRFSDRATLKIEAQSVAANAPRAPFERAHSTPFAERTVVHIGTVGEVPDFIVGPTLDAQAVEPVPKTREQPGARDRPSEQTAQALPHV